MKLKKLSIILCVSVLLASCFSGCGSSSKSGETANTDIETSTETVSPEASSTEAVTSSNETSLGEITDDEITVLAATDPQNASQQIVASKLGYFEDEGINVSIDWVIDPSINSTMIASQEIEIFHSSNYENLMLRDKSIPLVTLASIVDASNTQVVVGGPDLELTSAKDLEGKKMGYTDGAGVIVAVKNMCNDLGVDFDKIELVNLQAPDMLASLEKGNIDFFAAWEPWGLESEAFGGKKLFTGTQSYLPDNEGPVSYLGFYMTCTTYDSYIEEHPAECAAYLRALIRANEYINNNMEEASAMVAEQLGLDQEQCLEIMKLNNYEITYDSTYEDACNQLNDYMIESGMISNSVDFDSYTNKEILKSIDESLVKN